MNELSIDRLRELAKAAEPPCVSLYMPTHRRGVDLQQDPIRLDNLVRAAERLLETDGHPTERIAALLDPVRGLRTDDAFWAHQLDGLAILCHRAGPTILKLPLSVDELVMNGQRPYLKPLLPLLTGDGRYRVLSLSQGSVRMFEGNRDGLQELDIPDLPQSVSDVVGDDLEQKTPQQHSVGGDGRGIQHGSGGATDVSKQELEKFVRAVDQALHAALEGRICPLVVAAVDHVAAAFRNVTHARRMLKQTLSGNLEHLDAHELHARAWPLVAEEFAADLRKVTELVRAGLGTGKVVQRIEEVVNAAHEGRVANMLVAIDTIRWGRFDPDARLVEPHPERRSGDIDLLDRAATDCLLHGGRVHALRLDEMPGDDAKAIAVLRW
ncbi:MAG: hypothetical protein IPM29_14145 [Planctomycetes bacterium]|nr:hypothetical protein [Planctomycetota bacterium]